MTEVRPDIEWVAINTIRALAIDAIEKAKSGHPGLPLGAAPMSYVLWQRHLRHNPKNPEWPDRDRFVLSAGHGSMLLYSLLHLTGYELGLDELKAFRQWQSRTPGHPEAHLTPGVEATTGPLGQGAANSVGMAIAERMLAHLFNRPGHTIVDHRTYALLGDGDMMEGIVAEAASLAGHLELGKLIWLYDDNQISLDGPTSLTFTEDVAQRFSGCGWQVLKVAEGNQDLDAIDRALQAAQADTTRPSLIMVRTTIGYGAPHKQGTAAVHGSPLGAEEARLTKKALGWPEEPPFHIPSEALTHFRKAIECGQEIEKTWRERFAAYEGAYPELARSWEHAMRGELPAGWDTGLPEWPAGEKIATREAGGKLLNAIAKKVPYLAGGDADLSVSTNTRLLDDADFDGQTGAGRNIHFGVREHAMAAIANGMAYHGGLRPYTATFFTFSDYMRPAIRLAAMSHLPVVFVFTHDSIGLGEDGPTHQPIEHLAALRAVPNLAVVRPADANETREAWRFALSRTTGPTALVLTRQKLPALAQTSSSSSDGVRHGAYVVSDTPGQKPAALMLASGSEVHLALAAQMALAAEGIGTRVVSMPCWEAFAGQSQAYRETVLMPEVMARVAIEAGVAFGWERWVGERGVIIGLDRFGASAPAEVLFAHFGFSTENVAAAVRRLLA